MKTQTTNRLTMSCLFVMLAAVIFSPLANGQDLQTQSTKKSLALTTMGPTSGPFGHSGQSGAVTIKVKNGRTTLKYSVSGLTPNSVHGVWLILDTNQPPFVPGTAPNFKATDPATGTTADVFPFTLEAADDAAFTAGSGLDPNGFVTDASGNASFTIELNYDIFQPAVAPLVLRSGAAQTVPVSSASASSPCTGSSESGFSFLLDSAFMRAFDTSRVASPPGVSPSFPMLDGQFKTKLVRGNVKSIVLVEHLDGLTHGHVPGVGVNVSPCGDHVGRLTGVLANATP